MGRKKRRIENAFGGIEQPAAWETSDQDNTHNIKVESRTTDPHHDVAGTAAMPAPTDPRARMLSTMDRTTATTNQQSVPLCLPVNPNAAQNDTRTSSKLLFGEETTLKKESNDEKVTIKKSGYSMTSHSADLISEDIYVSDGSEDEDEMDDKSGSALELNLTSSKMGLMRRGMSSVIFQPKTWVRSSTSDAARDVAEGQDNGDETMQVSEDDNDDNSTDDNLGGTKGTKKEDLSNMDPAQRAAYLLMEKQKKLEEAKQLKRRLESAENAGRDPCLFSKRTAFDIRMDQIEEKPWDRASGGTADITDYFNYGMGEEDWLDYSERQKIVRQELTDAARQKRMPDPTIVPVAPKAPSRQAPKVAVVTKKKNEEEENGVAIGPILPKNEENDKGQDGSDANKTQDEDIEDNNPLASKSDESATMAEDLIGGAWGIPKRSKLAKMLEDQEVTNKNLPPPPPPPPPPPILPPMPMGQSPLQQHRNIPSRESEEFHRDGQQHGGFVHGQYPPEYPPPPPHGGTWRGGRGFPPGRGGPQMPPPPGRGFEGRGFPPPPPYQHFGGRGFRGGYRGGRGPPHGGGRGNWRR